MGRAVLHLLLERLARDVAEGDGCWLVALQLRLRRAELSAADVEEHRLRKVIEHLRAGGYTLRRHLPSVPVGLQEQWLGRRLVLGHARWFSADAGWTSIVSSRLGRYGRSLADWPALLELQLRSGRRAGSVYLAVADTTVARLVDPLLIRSAIPYLRVRTALPAEADIATWLAARLDAIERGHRSDDRVLYLSPLLPSPTPTSSNLSSDAHPFDIWPLQDRVAICWAARVRALLVRPRGTTAQLLERRLADPRFAAGSVSVWLPNASDRLAMTRAGRAVTSAAQLAWLKRGAVGWYVAPREPRQVSPTCRQRRPAQPALWQLTSGYALLAGRAPPEDASPRYLVHCVRGVGGALPRDAAAEFIAARWLAGTMPDESPWATLVGVLDSGRLRGRAALNRTDRACVSFSGVPLDELVARRSFQPHLGRWDWEPFGLMIERNVLEQLGARTVIYGDAATYRRLRESERPFFQPAKRRRGAALRGHWEEEREWRMLGDVRLHDLPRSSICVFVAYAHQARALARHSPWPVIWLQDAQTPALPGGSKRRPRQAARIGKS